nr:MAG TPA: hypothetical protein [Caudoviricetes sp.]
MFTQVQLCVLIVVTEFIVYAFLSKCLDTIKHCSTSKTYRKGLEEGLITPNEFTTIINKEEKKDENN